MLSIWLLVTDLYEVFDSRCLLFCEPDAAMSDLDGSWRGDVSDGVLRSRPGDVSGRVLRSRLIGDS